jgi:hypothetical protein
VASLEKLYNELEGIPCGQIEGFKVWALILLEELIRGRSMNIAFQVRGGCAVSKMKLKLLTCPNRFQTTIIM